MNRDSLNNRILSLANKIEAASNGGNLEHLAIAASWLAVASSMEDLNVSERFLRLAQQEISRSKTNVGNKITFQDLISEPTEV